MKMQSIVFTVTTAVTVKNHPTDSTKVIITIGGTDYAVDGHDLIIAANGCMLK